MATMTPRKTVRKAIGKSGSGNQWIAAIGSVLRGVLLALIITLAGVVLLALIIKWTSPSDMVISILNQALKLASIAIAVFACTRHGGESGLLKGAAIGLLYMLLGVIAYASLSQLPLQWGAYLADLGMGIAAGGLCGAIFPGLGTK